MKYTKGLPITGARPQNRPQANVRADQSATSSNAERMIRRPPQPFQTKDSAVSIPAPSNRRTASPATPKAHPNIGVARGMKKHVPGGVNAHPLYKVSAAKHNPSGIGGGMPSTGKGAPAVFNGKVGHYSGAAGQFKPVGRSVGNISQSGTRTVKSGGGPGTGSRITSRSTPARETGAIRGDGKGTRNYGFFGR